MEDLGLFILNEKVVVSSRTVAGVYEKEHKHVLRDIRNILDAIPEAQSNFGPSSYTNKQGKEMPEIIMDRQGFSMLVMGFTGEKAKRFTYQYTLAFEKMANKIQAPIQELSPQLQLLINMELKQKQLEIAIADTKEEIKGIREVVALNPTQWRKDTADLINKLARKMGGYEHIKALREESYKLLDQRFGVDLQTRLTNKRRRMADEGVCKSKRNKLNQLDVIADDKKLIEGYISIIKEMAIKYGGEPQ